MPIQAVVTANDTDGIVYDAEYFNKLIVATDVVVSSEAGSAIRFGAGSSIVQVAGMVASSVSAAISMGGNVADPFGVGANRVTVTSSGVVLSTNGAAIILNNGNNSVFNAGMIASEWNGAVTLGGDQCSLVNHGTISGYNQAVLFAALSPSSVNVLTNTGLIAAAFSNLAAFTSWDGRDEVTNRGTFAGVMNFFGGDDLLDNEGGTVTGTIFFGAGADELVGGSGRERAMGELGNDVLDFGGGNDMFLAGVNSSPAFDGNDDLDGGDGLDTYNARGLNSAVTVRLHEQRAVGVDIGQDILQNFENAFGTDFNDTLVGDAGRNVLRGGGGADTLNGLEGNDRIFGDAGTDVITGNTGRDVMAGGADADIFDFNSTADSAVGDSNRDFIMDFVAGLDDIDLSTIDANTTLGGNQAFTFISNAAFGAVAGQLRFTNFGGTNYTLIEGDVNGDGGADFQIGILNNIVLSATDFVL